jgi:hypothetical protein
MSAHKSTNLLRRVAEGRSVCPTLPDLDGIVQKKLAEADEPSLVLGQHERWVLDTHLPTCEKCQQAFQGLLTLATASRKATEQVACQV